MNIKNYVPARTVKIKSGFLILLLLISVLLLLLNSKLQTAKKVQLDAETIITQKMADCYKTRGANRCYETASQDLINLFPVEIILKILEKNEPRPEFYANCHELTHYLGRDEYKKTNSIKVSLPKGSHVCFEGYQHGVMEGYFIQKNLEAGSLTDEAIFTEIPKACGSRNEYEKIELFNQCLHGIGHAVMLLKESDVPQSLELCNALTTTSDKERCYSGVFMENSNSSTNKDHPSKYFKKEDPMYPCSILEEKYLRMCFRLQSTKFLEFTGHDWPKTISLCEKIPTNYQIECYINVGSLQIGFTQDLEKMKQNCDLIKSNENEKRCVEGVVSTLSVRFGGNTSKIINFCLNVDQDKKWNCYNQMGKSLSQWTKNKDELNNLCSEINEDIYVRWCQESVN